MKTMAVDTKNERLSSDDERLARRDAILARVYAKPAQSERSPWEDPSLYLLAFVVGMVAVVAALLHGGRWGAEPTAGAVFVLFSGAALIKVGLSRFLVARFRKYDGSRDSSGGAARTRT